MYLCLRSQHLYRHPQRLAELQQAATAGQAVIDHEKALEDFLCFYEDLYMEFSKFGRIDALHVCDNLGKFHLDTCLLECRYNYSLG